MVALPKTPPIPYRMTVDEFLGWHPDDAGVVWQLVDGEPQAMAPASVRHGRLRAQIGLLLATRLRQTGGSCAVVTAPGVVPTIRARDNVRIPDLAVTCGPDLGEALLSDPVLVVEILSPSNERETWTNVWAYAAIPSVREILLFASTSVRAHLLGRNDLSGWPVEALILGPGDTLRLDSVDGSWPLEEFYATTQLGA